MGMGVIRAGAGKGERPLYRKGGLATTRGRQDLGSDGCASLSGLVTLRYKKTGRSKDRGDGRV